MLHLRKRILSHLLSAAPLRSTSPHLSLRRLLSAAAPAVSPNPSFAVEEYLVSTCGLTRAQAFKASARLSHLKSPANPDTILAFLAGLGLSGADVTAVVNCDLERVVKPNVKLLAECGLGACDIAKLFIHASRILSAKPECFLLKVACVEGIGVPRGSGMFRQALHAISYLSEDKIAAKLDYLKKSLRWSDTEVHIAVSKGPFLLRTSNGMLQRVSEFLISEVGLQPAYIAHRPTMLTYSLEGRLKPRYYVMRFLMENGLLKRNQSYCTIVKLTEKEFLENFVCPHKEAAPYLAEDYAAACKGEVPARFR